MIAGLLVITPSFEFLPRSPLTSWEDRLWEELWRRHFQVKPSSKEEEFFARQQFEKLKEIVQ